VDLDRHTTRGLHQEIHRRTQIVHWCLVCRKTSQIRTLPNDELRSKIVTVYSGLKALVDTVNHYSEREQLWMNLSRQTEKIGLS
jgi:hypothetical protein